MREPDYDIRGLQEGIEKCKKNIKTFEHAIEGERQTIVNYRSMIETLEQNKRLKRGFVVDAHADN
jgi:exonuclease VII large subunit